MKEFGLGALYSVSLKYKILLGFLFSLLPMLAIVFITYFPSRDSALQSSHRQITLITTSGGEKLDVFFETGSNIFLEWTEEDVFGMAIEFSAIDELKRHFSILQKKYQDFSLLLITDENGTVLEEGHLARSPNSPSQSLKKSTVSVIEQISNSTNRAVAIVTHPLAETVGATADPVLLFSFRTTDSSGRHNGFFLAYMELHDLRKITENILRELKKSGFTTSRVAVMSSVTEKVVSYAGEQLEDAKQPFGPPLQTVLRKSIAGEINPFTTGNTTEYIIHIPIELSSTVSRTAASAANDLGLSLLTSVNKKDIMSEVRKTLIASIVIGGIGVLVILTIGYFTIRSITGPIGNLINVLQEYGRGNSAIRAEVNSHDEIGYFSKEFNLMLEQLNRSGTALKESETRYRTLFDNLQNAVNNKDYFFRFTVQAGDDDLALSLNRMLETLENADHRTEEEDWLKTGLTHLSEKISGEHKLNDLCENAITYIADYMGVLVGTIFVKSSENGINGNESYELIASYAFRRRKGLSNRYMAGEGLVGQAALEKKIIHFTEVPDDYIQIESSLGASPPTNILIIPLVYEGDVKGVIELGGSFPFTQRHLTFAGQVSSVIAVAINAALAKDRLRALLEQTRKQSEALQAQQEELQKANEELEEQTEILKQSEARLQVQQEELQASNEEMEEKNQLLEEQKRENEQANRDLKEKQLEIQQKARQLEIATKYKSEFLSNMSHELRTPLNSILLLAKMLSENDEKNLSEDQIESAAAIHRGGQTLLHLINDILDLSKIEAGRVELSISGIRPETITANFETEFNHLAKDKGLQFLTEVEEGLPDTLVTDVHRLEQIIRNLLGNSFKFTETGSVTLRIRRATDEDRVIRKDLAIEDTIAISVADTGPGIPKEKLDLIFHAFRQVDGSISRRHGGTGLGLSISRELAKLIGGEIAVESVPGQGADFTLYIPQSLTTNNAQAGQLPQQVVSTDNGKKQAAYAVPESSQEETEKTVFQSDDERLAPPVSAKCMLIIEDDKEFSNILSNFFQKSGYETIVASTGEIGIKYAIEHMPTAVILDIGLPGIDGWTVLNELKNNPNTRHIPVHIMSAYDDSCEGLKKGAVGYLTKPVDIDGLKSALSKIEHVLANSVKELLVVEDDNDLRNNILKLMSTRDINATTAETGSKAIDLLRSNNFDCMILDLGLPDISGFTLLDEIEKDTAIAKLPVIIYTGRDLTREETERLGEYSTSIVLKSAFSMERLLDETALFMHRVEQDMPEFQRKMIQEIREKDSGIKGKKILLVDDDMRNAFALSKFLKSKGVIVSIADNGKKALEVLASDGRPDMVLMDIMMPVMDGYEAMKEIRKKAEYKDLPILALTAKAMETDREECIRCGANDYLSKPIDTQKLLSMLRIWMY